MWGILPPTVDIVTVKSSLVKFVLNVIGLIYPGKTTGMAVRYGDVIGGAAGIFLPNSAFRAGKRGSGRG